MVEGDLAAPVMLAQPVNPVLIKPSPVSPLSFKKSLRFVLIFVDNNRFLTHKIGEILHTRNPVAHANDCLNFGKGRWQALGEFYAID